MTALARSAPFLILAGITAIAYSFLSGHRIRCLPRVVACRAARTALRALIAARSALGGHQRYGRVPGLPGDGKNCLSEDEFLAALIIELRWDRTAPEPERAP